MMIGTEPLPAKQKIVYGVFKGMGDLLSAAPVVAAQLDLGHQVWLLCFPGKSMAELIELIDFGPCRANLVPIAMPVVSGWTGIRSFLTAVSGLDPDLVWISPHASSAASSWKIPVLLWIVHKVYWRRATLAGATTERLSFLFDVTVPVDRRLPLAERERFAYSMVRPAGSDTTPDTTRDQTRDQTRYKPRGRTRDKVTFIDRVTREGAAPPKYDLLIHPGATAPNRAWPVAHYAQVIRLIPDSYRIALLGLPSDLATFLDAAPRDRHIAYLSGTLEEALKYIAQSRVVLTMDSGNAHFASVLGVKGVALFGKTDPSTVLSAKGCVLPIYQPKLACQPCQRVVCNQRELYCMNSILPETVANELLRLLAS